MSNKPSRLMAFKNNFPMMTAIAGGMMMGAAPIFVRLTDIGPNATAVYRLLFAMPLMILWTLLEKRANPSSVIKPRPIDYWWFILAGLFFSADLAFWHVSIDLTSVVNSSLLNNLTPIFVPLLLWALYANRPSLIYILSAVLAIIGAVVLTASTAAAEADNVTGDLLAISSALAYSGYIIVISNLRKKFNTPTIMLCTSFSNLISLALLTYFLHEDYTLSTMNDWIGVIGLAVFIHVFGQGMLAYSMGHLSAGFVSLTMLLGPIVSAILGWIVFDETLVWLQAVGGAIVLSSIAAARLDDRKKREKY